MKLAESIQLSWWMHLSSPEDLLGNDHFHVGIYKYGDGNLRAALVNMKGNKLFSYQLVTG